MVMLAGLRNFSDHISFSYPEQYEDNVIFHYLQIAFDEKEGKATISWERKDLEVPGESREVNYTIMASYDGSSDSKEVYK